MSKYRSNKKGNYKPKDERDDKKSSKSRSFQKKEVGKDSKTDVTTGKPFREYETTQKGGNDASWYAKNPQLLVDSASFSYNAALGSPMGWNGDIVAGSALGTEWSSDYSPSLPGIMSIMYANFPGLSKDGNSPINIAAQNIYSYVRHVNSGHANYDASDLMMYFVAMDSLYSFIAWCRRVYGTARVFSQKNYYYQRGLTGMQGVNYVDLITNLSDFRAFINTISAKASAFAVPSSMPIMQRHFFMASNVYKDRDSEKSQLYIFQPEGFHYYGLPSVVAPFSDAGACIFKPMKPWNSNTGTVTDRTMTVAEIIAYGNNLISHLLASEDIGIMSGDVLKAFQGNIFTIPATPEEYTVMPVFDPEILSQIQNSKAVPPIVEQYIVHNYAQTWDALDVLQNPNTGKILADFISWTEAEGPMDIYDRGDFLAAQNAMFTLNVDHPTPADTMVASRLCQAWKVELNGMTSFSAPETAKVLWTCEAVGTEVVLGYMLGVMTLAGNLEIRKINSYLGLTGNVGDVVWRDTTRVSNFNNHPFIYSAYVTISGNKLKVTPYSPLGDVDTYRSMSASDLSKMNTTALLSQYGVPALGTY